MAQVRKASKINSKINLLLWGCPFAGKSTLAMEMALLHTREGRPFRMLILDSESGGNDDLMGDLERKGCNLDNVLVVYSQSLSEIQYYIHKAANKEDFYEIDDEGNETDTVILDSEGKPFRVDCILVDGSSVLQLTSQQSLLELARRRAKIKANKNGLTGEEKLLAIDDVALSPREWGALNYSGQSLVLDLAGSGLHWCITAREKDVTENKYVNGKVETVATGEKTFASFKNIDYNAKTVARLYRDPDEVDVVKMAVQKDRTGTFAPGQVIENPTLLAFQKMIDGNDGEDVVVKNTMNQAIETEEKLYEKSLGIGDSSSPTNSSEPSSPTLDLETLRKDVKKYHSKMNPEQRKQFSDRIKAENIPTSLGKIEDTNILSRVVVIAKEIMEAE